MNFSTGTCKQLAPVVQGPVHSPLFYLRLLSVLGSNTKHHQITKVVYLF